MKKKSINVIIALACILFITSCSSDGKDAAIKKICGTWEVYSGITYNKEDFSVIFPEKPFEEDSKWTLIITDDGKITKPANNEYDEYDEEIKANYELYTGNEALEKGIIGKKHLRRTANSDDDVMLLFADKQIKGERLFQIVSCTSDTLRIRFLSTSPLLLFDDYIFEYKLVKK